MMHRHKLKVAVVQDLFRLKVQGRIIFFLCNPDWKLCGRLTEIIEIMIIFRSVRHNFARDARINYKVIPSSLITSSPLGTVINVNGNARKYKTVFIQVFLFLAKMQITPRSNTREMKWLLAWQRSDAKLNPLDLLHGGQGKTSKQGFVGWTASQVWRVFIN